MAETTPQTTPQADITQQATAPTPKKKPATEKNPKRVAAGKMVTERTRRAREAQKKAAEEGASIIANTAEEPKPSSNQPVPEKSAPESLTTTQWLALGSLIVSLIGLYYKRKEIKNAFTTPQATPNTPKAAVEVPPPANDRPRSLRNMD